MKQMVRFSWDLTVSAQISVGSGNWATNSDDREGAN